MCLNCIILKVKFLILSAYQEMIKFVKPAPIEEQQAKKDKKKGGGGKKGKGGKGDVAQGVENMDLGK